MVAPAIPLSAGHALDGRSALASVRAGAPVSLTHLMLPFSAKGVFAVVRHP